MTPCNVVNARGQDHVNAVPSKARTSRPHDEVVPPDPFVDPVEKPSMSASATRPVATIAALALLALSACGGGEEPPPSKSTSSSTSEKKQSQSESAEEAFRTYWGYQRVRANTERPSAAQRRLMTDSFYEAAIDLAKRSTKTRREGQDKLLSLDTKVKKDSKGYTGTLKVCYAAYGKSIALESGGMDGSTWEAGDDLRIDREGRPVKTGTKMVDRVTMKRGLAQNAQWKVHDTVADVDESCGRG